MKKNQIIFFTYAIILCRSVGNGKPNVAGPTRVPEQLRAFLQRSSAKKYTETTLETGVRRRARVLVRNMSEKIQKKRWLEKTFELGAQNV